MKKDNIIKTIINLHPFGAKQIFIAKSGKRYSGAFNIINNVNMHEFRIKRKCKIYYVQ